MSLAWGGYANGSIPATAMHVIPNFVPLYAGVDSSHASNMMMTEAAVQFSGLAHAFYLRFRKALNVSEAYRRLDRQQALYRAYQNGTGNLAAWPGTSNHGWGRSLDLASSVNINGSAENTWVRQNAPAYGFYFTVPSEAWHVDYIGSPRTRVKSYISNPNSTSAASAGSSSATPSTASQQTWLKAARGEKLKADGIRGPATIHAIKRYQQFLKKSYGYSGAIDGIWGPKVQAAHRKYYAYTQKPKAVRPTIKQGSSGAYVRTLQNHLGIKADGQFGPATKAAVVKLQKRKKLTADGIVGVKTWAALGL